MNNIPKNARIGIIGAGPGGLSAAEALREAGYTNVTVLEKKNRAGGMAFTLQYKTPDNREIIYEMGSLQPVSSPVLYNLIDRYDMHVGAHSLDSKNKKNSAVLLKVYSLLDKKAVIDFVKYKLGFSLKHFFALMRDNLKLAYYLFRYRHLAKPGFHLPPDRLAEVSIPYDQWVKERRFTILELPLLLLGVTHTLGVTEYKKDCPAIQPIKLFLQCVKWPPSRARYVNGVHKFFREGYQELWNRVAKMHNVILNANITRIERKANEVVVSYNDQEIIFDKIIITCPLTRALNFLDATDEEKTLFNKVKYFPGWRVAFTAKNLPHEALYNFLETYMTSNYGPCLQAYFPVDEVEPGVWLYSGGISLSKNEPIEPHLKAAETFLKEHFNAEVVEWVQTCYWPDYVPHFDLHEYTDGIHDKLENLQGKNNTYYAGGTMSGHSHATVVEYSYALVEKFFKSS